MKNASHDRIFTKEDFAGYPLFKELKSKHIETINNHRLPFIKQKIVDGEETEKNIDIDRWKKAAAALEWWVSTRANKSDEAEAAQDEPCPAHEDLTQEEAERRAAFAEIIFDPDQIDDRNDRYSLYKLSEHNAKIIELINLDSLIVYLYRYMLFSLEWYRDSRQSGREEPEYTDRGIGYIREQFNDIVKGRRLSFSDGQITMLMNLARNAGIMTGRKGNTPTDTYHKLRLERRASK